MADKKRTILSDYYDLAMKYKGLAEKTLEELNSCKQEMMQMKSAIMDHANVGQYIWDSKRIVISAPEIIIGNVNKHGELQGGGRVIIKGNAVDMQGVGDAGTINMRAPIINEMAVNPGMDGIGQIVGPVSTITSQARSVQLISETPQTVEGKGATFLPAQESSGISMTSDSYININSVKCKKSKKERIEKYKEAQQKIKDLAKSNADTMSQTLCAIKNDVEMIAGKDSKLSKENDLTKTNILALDELQARLSLTTGEFLADMGSMVQHVGILAEANRQIACMDKELEELDKVDDEKFKKDSTNTCVNVRSENIHVFSMDGEGSVRTNPGAGIKIRGNDVTIASLDEKAQLTPEEACGRVSVLSRNISLLTADMQDPKYDKGKRTSAKFPIVGNVTIRSKNVDIDAIEYEQTGENAYKETSLPEDSSVNIRATKVKVKTINEQGQSVGKFSVNSQKITMKSTDIDSYKPEIELDKQGNFKEKKMDSDKLAEQSSMLLLAQTMNVGFKKKDQQANKIFIVGDEQVVVKGVQKVDITQDGKSMIHFEGGNAEVSSSATMTLAGKDTKIHGNIALKGDVKGGDVEVENLKAKTSVTAPNITDGMSVPGAPATFNQSKPGEVPEYDDVD